MTQPASTWVSFLLAACCLISAVSGQTPGRVSLNSLDITSWVSEISTALDNFRNATLRVDLLESSYASAKVTGENVTDSESLNLLKKVKDRIQGLLWNSEKQVEAIRMQAEKRFASYSANNFSCSDFTRVPYVRATAIVKKENNTVNSTSSADFCSQNATLELAVDPRMNGAETTRILSTSFVPQYVYDASMDILNAANWTSGLETTMISSAAADPTLKWQFFGTTQGLFRIYPGIRWNPQQIPAAKGGLPNTDNFDCRSQNWYEIAASYPKDLVILIDYSGSMKGSNVIMVQQTLNELLASLTSNDFFNVILATGTADSASLIKYAADVYNRTMVQATDKNKARLQSFITEDALKPLANRTLAELGVADLGMALTEAFTLLKLVRENATTVSSGGVQAIALVTDSAADSYDAVFQKFNANGQIRLLTFLTSEFASDADVVRAMSCKNRGYFSQMATMSDVKESVMRAIAILARTNAINQDRFFTWSDVHQNQMQVLNMPDSSKFALYTSVAQVAYDLRNQTRSTGDMIGVAGVDVAVDQFDRQGPAWELGPLGYVFVVNNNGFVLYHPELKTVDNGNNQLMYYNSRDIAEIEYPAESQPQYNSPDYNQTLRIALIQRQDGWAADFNRLRLYNDNTRARRIRSRYFTTPLSSNSSAGNETARPTSLSLGLALPWGSSGQQWPQRLAYSAAVAANLTTAQLQLMAIDSLTVTGANCQAVPPAINASSQLSGTGLADFEFCDFPLDQRALYNTNPLCALGPALAANRTRQMDLKCSTAFLDRVYADVQITGSIQAAWRSAINGSLAQKLGAAGGILFLWSGGSGLARWQADPASARGPIDPTFIAQHLRNGTRDPLYERTASMAAEDPAFTVALTPPSADAVAANAGSNATYPRAFPVYLTAPVRVAPGAVAAVAGAELDYAKFEAYFISATNRCASAASSCATCALLNVNCYLLDTNGIVVASESRPDVGKTFDQVNCDATLAMMKQNLFSSVQAYDFQSVCTRTFTVYNSASTLFSPVRALVRLVAWALVEGFVIMSDLSTSLFGRITADAQAKKNAPVTANRTITGCQSYTLLLANTSALSTTTQLNSTCSSGGLTFGCSSDIYVRLVSKTNLVFVAVVQDPGCICQGCTPIVASPDLYGPVNFTLQQWPRKAPLWTKLNIRLTDNATTCSNRAARLNVQPSRLTLQLMLFAAMPILCDLRTL